MKKITYIILTILFCISCDEKRNSSSNSAVLMLGDFRGRPMYNINLRDWSKVIYVNRIEAKRNFSIAYHKKLGFTLTGGVYAKTRSLAEQNKMRKEIVSQDPVLSLLKDLVENNDTEKVVEIVAEPNIVNFQKSKDGRNLLHEALNNGEWKVATTLLEFGGSELDLNTEDVFGETPLLTAVRKYAYLYEKDKKLELERNICLKVINLLIDNGAKINIKSSYSDWTALHYATVLKEVELIKLLLEKGAEIIRDRDNRTPVTIAKEYNFSEIVDVLDKAEKGKMNVLDKAEKGISACNSSFAN